MHTVAIFYKLDYKSFTKVIITIYMKEGEQLLLVLIKQVGITTLMKVNSYEYTIRVNKKQIKNNHVVRYQYSTTGGENPTLQSQTIRTVSIGYHYPNNLQKQRN